MKKHFTRFIVAIIAVVISAGALAGCGNQPLDNEKTPLVFATQELDGVFNPFFATSGYDTTVLGMTQLSMLNTDKNGGIAVGPDEACIVSDYTEDTVGSKEDQAHEDDYENFYTTYRFVIKNGLKFSDGSQLTIEDVLFNMYVYLDPVYTGSSTMYSVNIKGLNAYRAQTYNENEQAAMDTKFSNLAYARINNVLAYCDDRALSGDKEAQAIKDIKEIKNLFKEELESDWSISQGETETYKEYKEITEGWQIFFIREGVIQLDEEKKTVKEWAGFKDFGKKYKGEELKTRAVQAVFDRKVNSGNADSDKDGIAEVVQFWGTAITAHAQFKANEMSLYFEEIKKNGLVVPNISGIEVEKASQFKGEEYKKRVADGRLNAGAADFLEGQEHDVLKITVNGIDPKAIWNFGFTVAPMKYYSTAKLASEADYVQNKFGVSYGDEKFMNETVKGRTVPVGAGPYMATNSQGTGKGQVAYTEFYKDGVVYYERNENFVLGIPKIKYMRYKTITANRTYDSVKNGEVHYGDPSAKVETLKDIGNNKSKLGSDQLANLGYGYIGINAKYVPDLNVRKAIMYALDPELIKNYYPGTMASVIYRPMSNVSWAYPENCKPYYDFNDNKAIAGDPEKNHDGWKSEELIGETYTKKGDGKFYKLNPKTNREEPLKLTFTVAGDTSDHPSYATLENAAAILNKIGCDITVVTDPNALSKLSGGLLTVWSAAWSSTIDPDMFQVYHKDSKATSVNNWGYPYILNGDASKDDWLMVEQEIIGRLSDKIDEAREVSDRETRTPLYHQALDMVMELAVEFPLYQRNNLFVWNKTVIDESTLLPKSERSAYNSPIAKPWEISFVNQK